MYMYIYMYIYVYICIYICVYIYIHMWYMANSDYSPILFGETRLNLDLR